MRLRSGLVWAVAAVGLAAGCGGGNKGTLTGKVTAGGKPVEHGTVMVRGGSGEVVLGSISRGEYAVDGVTGGRLKIAVVPGSAAPPREFDPKALREKGNFGAERAKREAAEARAAGGPTIPGDYQDLDRSPITHDTAAGGFTRDIRIP
jgi:hypothetical protein